MIIYFYDKYLKIQFCSFSYFLNWKQTGFDILVRNEMKSRRKLDVALDHRLLNVRLWITICDWDVASNDICALLNKYWFHMVVAVNEYRLLLFVATNFLSPNHGSYGLHCELRLFFLKKNCVLLVKAECSLIL